MVGQVDDEAVEAVRDRRAGRAAGRVLGPEHEVVDEQLRAPSEQVGEGRGALVGVEDVLLVDADPRELLPLPGQLVAAPRQLLLGLEQLQPGREPLFPRSGLVTGHCLFSPFVTRADVSHRWHEPGNRRGRETIQMPSPTIASASGTSMAALAGSSFWARTTTAITDIQVMLMTPSATSISISPMLEPTQQSPNPNPERTLSRQRRRKCRLSGVSS